MAATAVAKGLRHFTLGAGVMFGCDMATEVAIKCPPLYDTVVRGLFARRSDSTVGLQLNGAAHAIDYAMQHPAVLIRSFALRQKGLANKLPASLALGSQAAALYLTSSYGADLTGRLARWRWIKGETEEMPLLSRRRQPLPAPSCAIRTPLDTKSFYIKFLPVIGAGAAYLPANHPLTRVAERLRDIHLLAMEALVVERHGANSAVAAAFRANSRSSPIPIRVY
ncbi:hypothetical protein D9Q98_002493 [Chlorella vulgaris]|uniref:Uncharacterized protein n=1 Tax=Chlorella vulgaris TaxID=3077 RepID=A0A9D4TUS2_CHLVU|nr:hypothetical protein D9Q98_002493 [Chlorella vulgaris]